MGLGKLKGDSRLRLLPPYRGARQDCAGRVAIGGKAAPTFPNWLHDGTKPSRVAWFPKQRILLLYWQAC